MPIKKIKLLKDAKIVTISFTSPQKKKRDYINFFFKKKHSDNNNISYYLFKAALKKSHYIN